MFDSIKHLILGVTAIISGILPLGHHQAQINTDHQLSLPKTAAISFPTPTPTTSPLPDTRWTIAQQNTFINGCRQDGSNQNMCACTLQYFQARYSPDEYITLQQQFKGIQNPPVWIAAKNYCSSSNPQIQKPTSNNSSGAGGDQTYQNDTTTPQDYNSQYINPEPTAKPSGFGTASSYNQVGNRLYGSDGTSYSQLGNTTMGNNGTIYHSVGNQTYGSDGTSYNHVGNFTYGSNGTTCYHTGGTMTICN